MMLSRSFKPRLLCNTLSASWRRTFLTVSNEPPNDHVNPVSKKQQTSVERLVGYPTPLLSLRHLVGSELTQLSIHVRRLMSSQHPIIKQSKWFFDSPESSQTHGMMTLLTAKALNLFDSSLPDVDQFGILPGQRALAEITEMIHMAHMIHKEVVTLETNQDNDFETSKDLSFGNKLVILGGDLLLARACKELALLYKPQIVKLISLAISNLMTGRSLQETPDSTLSITESLSPSLHSLGTNNSIPRQPRISQTSLEYFSSLLSSSCHCSAILAELNDDLQDLAKTFGKHLSMFQQTSKEITRSQYTDSASKTDSEISAVYHRHYRLALYTLDQFPVSEARHVLEGLITASTIH